MGPHPPIKYIGPSLFIEGWWGKLNPTNLHWLSLFIEGWWGKLNPTNLHWLSLFIEVLTEDSMILWFQFEAPWIVQDAKTYQDPILLRSMPDTLADFQDEHFDSGIETFGGQISELPSAATNLLCRALPWTPSMESNPRAKLHIETCNCGNECESTNPLLSSLNVQMWRQRRSMAWISLVRVKVKSGRVTIWASEGQLPFTWQLQTLGGSEARRALFFGESSNGRHSELPDHLFSFTIDSHYNLFDT
ncbi:hypothetical protein C8J56DRAFT_880776 [Mycena floridula]|nr:hypothetical protein C8J56DRAFT_880776 [Mycena floridula]